MLVTCYLKDGIIYLPTMARRETEPVYTDIEPVAVAPLDDLDHVRRVLFESFSRKNITIPSRDAKASRAPPVILKYAGVRSWAAFFGSASTWNITEDDGLYKILFYNKHPKGYWEPDPGREIQFVPGTTVSDIVDRMITILQEASQPSIA
jgi:hypothetical protein